MERHTRQQQDRFEDVEDRWLPGFRGISDRLVVSGGSPRARKHDVGIHVAADYAPSWGVHTRAGTVSVFTRTPRVISRVHARGAQKAFVRALRESEQKARPAADKYSL